MQEKNEVNQLRTDLDQLVCLSRHMISLALEQRTALITRDLDQFEEVTSEYTKSGQIFNSLSSHWGPGGEEIFSGEDRELSERKEELALLIKELKGLNQGNLDLIRTSSEVMRGVLNMLKGQSSTLYGELGEVVEKSQKPVVLDRKV